MVLRGSISGRINDSNHRQNDTGPPPPEIPHAQPGPDRGNSSNLSKRSRSVSRICQHALAAGDCSLKQAQLTQRPVEKCPLGSQRMPRDRGGCPTTAAHNWPATRPGGPTFPQRAFLTPLKIYVFETRALLSHKPAELTDDCSSSGV